MIIICDQVGNHEGLFDRLMKPTGVDYKIINNFSEELIVKVRPSSLILYVEQTISDGIKDFLLKENRDYLLILLCEKEIDVDERIKYSSEIVMIDPNDLENSRKKLRQALTSYTVRRLKQINNSAIYLAKNGLYPGNVYYTKPENGRVFTSMILSNVIDKKKVLVVSRYNLIMELPDILDQDNFIWVTDSIGAQRNRPVNLSFITDSILKKITENDVSIIFVDVFDLLIVYHSFFDVARAFEQIKSLAIEKNIYLILAFGEQGMDHIQFGQITRYSHEWDPKSVLDLNETGN